MRSGRAGAPAAASRKPSTRRPRRNAAHQRDPSRPRHARRSQTTSRVQAVADVYACSAASSGTKPRKRSSQPCKAAPRNHADHLRRVRVLHSRARAPARNPRAQEQRSADRAARRRSMPSPLITLGRPAAADHQGAPSLRAAPEAALVVITAASARQPAVPVVLKRILVPRPSPAPHPPNPCWPTRPTLPRQPLLPAPPRDPCTIPEKATRSATGRTKAGQARRPPSTPSTTKPAMPWNAASAAQAQPSRGHPL